MALKYPGNFSATDPQYSRYMICQKCNVSWTGCWDNFECPLCRKGELPGMDNSNDTRAQEEIFDDFVKEGNK